MEVYGVRVQSRKGSLPILSGSQSLRNSSSTTNTNSKFDFFKTTSLNRKGFLVHQNNNKHTFPLFTKNEKWLASYELKSRKTCEPNETPGHSKQKKKRNGSTDLKESLIFKWDESHRKSNSCLFIDSVTPRNSPRIQESIQSHQKKPSISSIDRKVQKKGGEKAKIGSEESIAHQIKSNSQLKSVISNEKLLSNPLMATLSAQMALKKHLWSLEVGTQKQRQWMDKVHAQAQNQGDKTGKNKGESILISIASPKNQETRPLHFPSNFSSTILALSPQESSSSNNKLKRDSIKKWSFSSGTELKSGAHDKKKKGKTTKEKQIQAYILKQKLNEKKGEKQTNASCYTVFGKDKPPFIVYEFMSNKLEVPLDEYAEDFVQVYNPFLTADDNPRNTFKTVVDLTKDYGDIKALIFQGEIIQKLKPLRKEEVIEYFRRMHNELSRHFKDEIGKNIHEMNDFKENIARIYVEKKTEGLGHMINELTEQDRKVQGRAEELLHSEGHWSNSENIGALLDSGSLWAKKINHPEKINFGLKGLEEGHGKLELIGPRTRSVLDGFTEKITHFLIKSSPMNQHK